MIPLSLDDYFGLGRVTAAVPSPDGTWLAVAVSRPDADRTKLVSALWRVPLDGSPPEVLTRGPHTARAPCFRRDGALGFLSDRSTRDGKPEDGDDERAQVFVLGPQPGDAVPLTDEPLGVTAFRFAKDGDRLVVLADVLVGVPHDKQREVARERAKKGPSARHYARMPVRFWDHWIPEAAPHVIAYDACGGGRRDLTPDAVDEHRDASFDVSRDGALVAVTSATLGVDRVWDVGVTLLDASSGGTRSLAGGSQTMHASPVFSPDGARLATSRVVRAMGREGKHELVVHGLADGSAQVLAATWDRWPIPVSFTDDGTRVVCTADDDGDVALVAIALADGAVTRVTTGHGSHEGVSLHGRCAYGVFHDLLHPPSPFRVALAGGGTELVADLSGLAPGALGAVVVERFDVRADDGERVQSFVVRPKDVLHAPVLFWVHGGPVHLWADGWQWRWNAALVATHGYAVVLPNPRGSTGRGQDFVEGVVGAKWNEQCVRDLHAVADALPGRQGLDTARIGAMGGSFGGYMMNWFGVTTQRFRCLVTHASVFRADSFFTTTDLPAWASLEIGKSPWAARDVYDAISPHAKMAEWRTPTLVIHGEKDYRVPIGEGLALFEALQAHRVPSELLVFPDENHWILKPRNGVVWYETVFAFLSKYV